VGVLVVALKNVLKHPIDVARGQTRVTFGMSWADMASYPYCYPHPPPLPTRGRGVDRDCRLG
jgi:hypothetical protein